jgi:RimJ/RimL family protein N-acetyltransferase
MPDLRLIPIDDDLAAALNGGAAAFEARYQAYLGDVAALVHAVVDRTPATPSGWGGFLAVDEATGAVAGTCAFKGAPDADGTVEIAYFTFPPFERRGYALAMARALIDRAWAAPEVRRVIAHTLPTLTASTRVLEKAGMHCQGAVLDPEDGRVWRWSLTRPAAPAGPS